MQINGFSKLSKKEKIDWLLSKYLKEDNTARQILEQYWHNDESLQKLHDDFVENPVSNFYLPYAIAPNFLIDGKLYAVPMVTEESSVVAAASKAAKFWSDKGGFKTEVPGMVKTGHIHLIYKGSTSGLIDFFRKHRQDILKVVAPLEENMKKRGGGVKDINLIDKTSKLADYYQIEFKFETANAMGANFINTILEEAADYIRQKASEELSGKLEIVMSILSNYNPECVVKSEVRSPVNRLATQEMSGEDYARKFVTAVRIAEVETYRAVTHNKGIMNGVDAVVLATGNDFRAVEAGAHAYAARSGQYKSLSTARIENDELVFSLEIPLTLGTVGGLTRLHPLVKFSLDLLQNPSAEDLMRIVASVGLAQNFAAINSLITGGIQKGHMKMHLNNLLNLLQATEEEKAKAVAYFADKKVNFNELKKILNK